MNATLFENIVPTRNGLMPNVDELIHYGWATTIVEQEMRAAGFAGSIVVPLTVGNKGTDQITYFARAAATLPYGAYGTFLPPAIFSCVQYGSNTIVYKTLSYKSARDYRFRTWISDLRHIEKTEGGVTAVAWTFNINHYSDLTGPSWLDGPSVRNYGFIPPSIEYLSLNNTVTPTVTLWWYAMGYDPNLSI